MAKQTESRLRAREFSRVDIRGILSDSAKRRLMLAGTIRFIQQIEGRDLSFEDALAVYDRIHQNPDRSMQ